MDVGIIFTVHYISSFLMGSRLDALGLSKGLEITDVYVTSGCKFHVTSHYLHTGMSKMNGNGIFRTILKIVKFWLLNSIYHKLKFTRNISSAKSTGYTILAGPVLLLLYFN